MKKEVVIHTDGACRGNPGPGGWAAVLSYGPREKEISGHDPATTNQRMELTAAIKGLQGLREPCRVNIYSDSAYLVNAFVQGWLARWQKNGWQTKAGRPVENQDLWRELLSLCRYHEVQWHKVAGHSGHKHNDRCDALARKAIDSHPDLDGSGRERS